MGFSSQGVSSITEQQWKAIDLEQCPVSYPKSTTRDRYQGITRMITAVNNSSFNCLLGHQIKYVTEFHSNDKPGKRQVVQNRTFVPNNKWVHASDLCPACLKDPTHIPEVKTEIHPPETKTEKVVTSSEGILKTHWKAIALSVIAAALLIFGIVSVIQGGPFSLGNSYIFLGVGAGVAGAIALYKTGSHYCAKQKQSVVTS